MAETHLSNVRFTDLAIHEKVLSGIADTGFEYCTPIQAQALPLALEGHDVSGQAQTGTGKTAAFLIACLDKLLRQEPKKTSRRNPIRALIVAPTRELAIQIMEDGKPLTKHTGLRLGLAYGGTDYEKQKTDIEKGIDILVGTPGRIIDYFKQGVFALDALEVIILDEADRMFDLGFISDIRYLFRAMPAPSERLNLLFSATLSHRVAELAYEHMSEPQVVKIDAEITAERIDEIGYMPANDDKIPLLMGLIERAGDDKCVVFLNTKHMAEKVAAWLDANNFKCALLSGDVPQKKRERLLSNFKEGKVNILIATDVAARGLHIPDVNYVVNFDLPTDAEDYVHRIGRTARAGASGTAISLVCETYAMNIMDIEAFIEHSIPIEKEYSELMFSQAIKPDLSKLKSNRKKDDKKQGRQSKDESKQRHNKERDRRQGGNPNKVPKNQRGGRNKQQSKPQLSPQQREAEKVAAMEKRKEQGKLKKRMPLRGHRQSDIPAIG